MGHLCGSAGDLSSTSAIDAERDSKADGPGGKDHRTIRQPFVLRGDPGDATTHHRPVRSWRRTRDARGLADRLGRESDGDREGDHEQRGPDARPAQMRR